MMPPPRPVLISPLLPPCLHRYTMSSCDHAVITIPPLCHFPPHNDPHHLTACQRHGATSFCRHATMAYHPDTVVQLCLRFIMAIVLLPFQLCQLGGSIWDVCDCIWWGEREDQRSDYLTQQGKRPGLQLVFLLMQANYIRTIN